MARRKILVLFAQEWDRLALADPSLSDRYDFVHSGFDLIRFPQNARLLTFDVHRCVDRSVRLARREGVAGVISPHEQFVLWIRYLFEVSIQCRPKTITERSLHAGKRNIKKIYIRRDRKELQN